MELGCLVQVQCPLDPLGLGMVGSKGVPRTPWEGG